MIIFINGKKSHMKEMNMRAAEKMFSHEEKKYVSGVKLPPNLAERFKAKN